MKFKSLLFLLATVSTIYASSISVENSYIRATPPSLPNSAAFMDIKNSSNEDISLISASSDIAKAVELHTHDMKDGIMTMYQVEKIDIKANSTTVLKPGGFHVMFIGLNKKPLKEGETIDLTLNFSNNESVKITAPVKKVMSGMMMKKHGMKKDNPAMSCGGGKCGGNGKCGSN